MKRLKDPNLIEERETDEKFPAYQRLLSMYAAAIRDSSVNEERSDILFMIASNELGEFTKRWNSAKVKIIILYK